MECSKELMNEWSEDAIFNPLKKPHQISKLFSSLLQQWDKLDVLIKHWIKNNDLLSILSALPLEFHWL